MKNKKYKEATFHSSLLIPWFVVDGIDDEMKRVNESLEWLEKDRKHHFFAEPDEVCHRDNIFQKMTVKAVIRQSSGKDGKSKIIGIRCSWWEDC